MKSFFWKFVLCIVPVLLGTWATYRAYSNYTEGLPGGFKLGVDLVGGTILQYEIDVRKQDQKDTEGKRLIKLFSVPDKKTGQFHEPIPSQGFFCWCGLDHEQDFWKFDADCNISARTLGVT